MPSIVSICYSPPVEVPRPQDHYHRVSVSEARLVEECGIEGDRKSKGGARQINLMSAETLAHLREEGFRTGPGEMGEQIVLEGIDVDSLRQGDRLGLGDSAVIEIGIPRTGCDRFEKIQGMFKGLVRGRMGVIARVITGGPIAVGDPVAAL